MVLYRLESRSMATNVPEINRKVLNKMSRHSRSSLEGQSYLGTFVFLTPEGDSVSSQFCPPPLWKS